MMPCGVFKGQPGQGSVSNEDGLRNAPDNAAVKGTAVYLIATGGGVTAPFPSDGSVVVDDGSQPPKPVASVAVTIGGVPAEVQEAVAVPGLVSGFLRVKVTVPNDAPSGNGIPVVLTVGGVDSPAVTMSVQ